MPSLGVRSPSSPGVGIGVGGSTVAEAGGANPNLLLWSEEFQREAWTANGVTVTADNANDPDGVTVTADLLDPTPGGGGFNTFLQQVSSAVPVEGRAYTFSFWMKRAQGSDETDFRLGDGVGVSSANFGSAVEWTRVSITRTAAPGSTELRVTIQPMGTEIGETDLTTIWVWGAKLEEGAVATAYVKREGT